MKREGTPMNDAIIVGDSDTKGCGMAGARKAKSPRPNRGRPRGQVATRDNILRAAIQVFSRHGFAGARVERISRAARSTDRLIYYYFGSKEGLYVAVLETIYRDLGEAESKLELDNLAPKDAIRKIFRFTWEYYLAHPEMLALLNNENLQEGRHLARSKTVRELSMPLITTLSRVLKRGIDAGEFRPNIHARDIYIAICALGYFYLSNRFTLSAFLDVDLMDPKTVGNWGDVAEDALLRIVGA
jgi:TetR/AcrR family transcriptional regulator, upper aerobic nicotinate degradation pathway regulator